MKSHLSFTTGHELTACSTDSMAVNSVIGPLVII